MRTFYMTLVLFGVGASTATGAIFSENFDTENGGAGQLNYTGFTQFAVSGGTVDLIGDTATNPAAPLYDLLPGNGLYVDLDGTSNDSGLLFSTATISLGPGTYTLSFQLAGSQRGSTETAAMVFQFLPGSLSDTVTLLSPQGFTTFSYTFSVVSATTGTLNFQGVGGDNVGLLLDNIVIDSIVIDPNAPDAVPEPATLTMFGMGGIGLALGALRRRFRKRA